MSSDRPGGPADVVPGDDEPDAERSGEAGADTASTDRTAKKKNSLLRELPVLLLVAFVLALVVKTFFVQAFFIPSGSMEQTLHGCAGCTGDRVLVNKVPYWFGEPEPGDVVVFEGPDTWTPEIAVEEPSNWFTGAMLWLGRTLGVAPPSEDDFVKRVIATEGQTVQCCDVEGRLTVDGEPLDEPYLFENMPIEQRPFGPVTVPEGRLWVMGDHRSASADSREHVGDKYSGTVGVDDVIGKASVIVWPIDRFGGVDSPDIQGLEATGEPIGGTSSPVGAVVAVPCLAGLAGAVPLTAWRRRRRRRGRE
jgi:signal peptidase I